MRLEGYTVYSYHHDITFIMVDMYDDSDNVILTEVKGFYYGEPSLEKTKEHYGKLKARFTPDRPKPIRKELFFD